MSFAAEPGGPIGAPTSGERGLPAALLTADEDLRLLIRGVLALDHRSVLVEGSGPEFLRLLAGSEGPLALFYDLSDPGRPWREELAALLRDHPNVRPIVLLAPGQEGLVEEALQHGARAVIVRPIALGELARAVRDAEREDRVPPSAGDPAAPP